MFYIYVENNTINGNGQCRCLNEDTLNIEVSEEIYNNFSNNPDKYIFKDSKIVENPDYETVKQKNVISEEINNIIFELNELDTKRIRAVCENEVKDSETGETWLKYYNDRIKELRAKLNELQSQL